MTRSLQSRIKRNRFCEKSGIETFHDIDNIAICCSLVPLAGAKCIDF